MAIIKHYGEIKEGKLIPYNRKRLASDLSQMKDCEVEITIKRKGKRSLKSLGYYFGCVLVEIQQELKRRGNDFDRPTIHDFLKGKFYTDRIIIEETGEVLEMPKSLADANQDEMSAYLEAVLMWCSNTLELAIPEPNSQALLFA